MTPDAQHIAAALAAWRETLARERNRPRRWILEDDAVYRLAERRPQTLEQLRELNVLPPKTLERHGEALLGVLAAVTPSSTPLDAELDSEQKARLQSMQARIKQAAENLQLPPGFIAPRADLIELVLKGAAANIPLLQGWRREHVGVALLVTA